MTLDVKNDNIVVHKDYLLQKDANTSDTVAEAVAGTEKAAVHEHSYTETVTTAATCTEDGVMTYTCECGDTYTEEIPATGHSFTNYVYNEDATFDTNGTETARCDNCDETDTRIAEGTQLSYTYKDMDVTKYAKSSVNVRNMPETEGDKVGTLSFNQEVKVTGQCNETGWYRIEFSGETAYVSDSYLVDDKAETATENKSSVNDSTGSSTDAGSSSSGDSSGSSSGSSESASSGGPTLYTIFYDNRGLPYFYVTSEEWTKRSDKYKEMCATAASIAGDSITGMSCYYGSTYTLMYCRTGGDANIEPDTYGIKLYP